MRTGTVNQPESGIAECGRARPASISSSRSARGSGMSAKAPRSPASCRCPSCLRPSWNIGPPKRGSGITSTPSQFPTSPTSASTATLPLSLAFSSA